MKPLISIITPAYNSSTYIEKTILSVYEQTFQNWELLIIDDCSTDNTIQILNKLLKSEKRATLYKLKSNSGTAIARNIGLENVNGRFITFLDSDDIWTPKKLEKQVAFMLETKCPICFTSYELIDEDGRSKNHTIKSIPYLTQTDYLKNTIIGLSTSMIDTMHVGSSFRFIDIRTRQDTSLWISLLGKGHSAYGLDEILVKYRVHQKSISSNRIKAAKQVWRLYYKIHKLGLFHSFYYFSFYAYNAIKKRI